MCFSGVTFVKAKFKYDDSLDAFGCHGIGGIWGGIATGIFASTTVNPAAGQSGLYYGNIKLLGIQLIAIVVTIIYSAVVTFVILKVVNKFIKLRVSDSEERVGLDISLHGEEGYGVLDI